MADDLTFTQVSMIFNGFVGPAYRLDSVDIDCQNLINMYPELIQSGTGKAGQVAYLRETPGLEILMDVGSGPIRCVHNTGYGTVYIVSGDTVYLASQTDGVWGASSIGTLETSEGIVNARSIKVGEPTFGYYATIFVDGTNNYLHQVFMDATPSTWGTFAAYGYPPVLGATHIEQIDGYFIYNQDNKFFVSDINSININPLSFASAEGDPDNIVGQIALSRNLILFGERTTELWANTGNADFPFERVSGGFNEMGCAARYSIAKAKETVFWLSRSNDGQGVVYAMTGFTPQRISTHAIEIAISSYGDMTQATGYAYQKNGHVFYVLNFSETSWCYDLSTNMWHERCYLNAESELERHRANSLAFVSDVNNFEDSYIKKSQVNVHIVGDWENGKVYILNDNYRFDDEQVIVRERTFPHVSAEGNRLFFNSLQLDMEVGVGLDGGGQGSDPQVMMTFSNDGGHTWSSESWTSSGKKIGGVGEYKKRVKWNRLGSARDRVFKIRYTEPTSFKVVAAYLDLTTGVS